MKEIKAQVTLLCSGERIALEIRDKEAGIMFVDIEMSSEQFTSALGRLAHVNVDKCIVRGLDKVGKKREVKEIEFELGKNVGYGDDRKRLAKKEATKNCPDDWTPRLYFDSQNSFFYKGESTWARCHIERWI